MSKIVRIPMQLLSDEQKDELGEMLTNKLNQCDGVEEVALEEQIQKLTEEVSG